MMIFLISKFKSILNSNILSKKEYLKNNQEPKGVSVSIDTLWRLINSWELRGCIESIITDIIETLVELINESKSDYFFDFLEKVIHNYTFVIKNYATNIIKNLCRRIEAE